MESIQNLIKFILQQERCIVFGDLGRYPQHLLENLNSNLKVLIISRDGILHSSENHIRFLGPTDVVEKCDLLIYLEPPSMHMVEKHPLAAHVAVFTSHFSFKIPCDEWWTNICFFLKADSEATRELLEKQEFPIQTRNIGLVQINHVNVLTITGKHSLPPNNPNTYVIVDLTQFNKDTLSMYLAFWDSFDFMLENRHLIDRWVVCFSENGNQVFNRFTQNVLDSLFCRKFEHGNKTDIHSIVTLLPFYKSGTIDKTFDVKVYSLGGLEFVVPKTKKDACKAAAMYDIYPIVKNVFGVRKYKKGNEF